MKLIIKPQNTIKTHKHKKTNDKSKTRKSKNAIPCVKICNKTDTTKQPNNKNNKTTKNITNKNNPQITNQNKKQTKQK